MAGVRPLRVNDRRQGGGGDPMGRVVPQIEDIGQKGQIVDRVAIPADGVQGGGAELDVLGGDGVPGVRTALRVRASG